jgi:hypothetical protein
MRGGSRFYVDASRPEIKHPGVTSIIGMLPKPFLAPWNAKLTAELAVDSFDFLDRMAKRDRQGAIDYLKGAARRYTTIRADVGSNAHDLFERLIRGEDVGRVHPDMMPYKLHFEQFLDAVNPELVRAEDIAWSDSNEYAGSFDVILRVWLDDEGNITPDRTGTPVLLIADWKTSKDIHAEVALQLAAYARADFIVCPDGTHEPMPEVDGAAVLHITDTQWSFRSIRIDDDVFDLFLTLRKIFTWDRETNRTVIGRALAKSVKRLVTGTERRGK